MAAEVRRINCKNCAAPLELHGGHRVETLTCSYCGSVLDAQLDYEIIARHHQEARNRDHLPLKLGMQGRLKGVDFTVIGLISYRADVDIWTEFCLFSPTHGYVWLSWNDGHFVFNRRERDVPIPSGSWAGLAIKHKIRMGGRQYRFFEAYAAEVIDVAGELPWRAEEGDGVAMAEAIDPPWILAQEAEGEELEYYLGEYLEHTEVAEGFGLTLAEPNGVHPAMPYRPSRLAQALGINGRLFAVLVLVVLVALLGMGHGRQVMEQGFYWQEISGPGGVVSQPFQVEDVDRLVEAEFYSNIDNAWLWLEVSLLKDGEPLFTTGREVSYYHGYEGGESWSEGSRSASLLFKVPEAGSYQLELNAEGEGSQFRQNLSLRVSEGVLLVRWFLILLPLMALAALLPLLRRGWFETRRWAPVTEDDDDD